MVLPKPSVPQVLFCAIAITSPVFELTIEIAAAFEPYTVNNSTRSGVFDMNQGLAYSVNTYFMGLEELTGLCRPVDIAEKLGVRTGVT